MGPSVFPDSRAILEWLVLQYRVGPAVLPDSRFIPERLVLEHFQRSGTLQRSFEHALNLAVPLLQSITGLNWRQFGTARWQAQTDC